ncbi:hypothetical protein DOTSEDRAFT_40289 [Dothistroma septosporum NZE10]|uniref:Peroxin 20 n=1 Tax=Dothistroma septosporum (strain NZE10 / CBS 128990) TaxID=675120 RepID=N1PZW1_DOTSN|nr:hypothetical protein DOTSEDRAFT_40289 [Dothistroma septosporum NZE10]
MAEAMCGPSNPLQQFRKQGNRDRTLQQDRLTARHHPAAGFRSHDPNAGLLDPEFEAFQAGSEPPIFDHAQPLQAPQGLGGPSQAPPWAADFQNLHISPQPLQQQPHFQSGPGASNWAQDFSAHLAQSAPKLQQSSQSPLEFQQTARGLGNFGFQRQFAQPSFAPAMQSKGKEPVMAEQYDESAFERAFDQARADMMAEVEDATQENIEVEDVQNLVEKIEAAAEQEATQMLNESNRDLEELHSMPRMHGADVEYDHHDVLQEEEQSEQRQQQEDDALAATAQELLGKVEHNKSDKFKNSQFLGLMRKLADREMRVEGDKMVETVSPTQSDPEPAKAHYSYTHAPVTGNVLGLDVSDHEFDHWESPYT